MSFIFSFCSFRTPLILPFSTTTQERICLDAQSRLSSLPIPGVTISSCIAKCCDTNNCNVPELIDSAPTPDSPTTKAKNGLGQIQSFTSLVSCQLILTFWFKQCIWNHHHYCCKALSEIQRVITENILVRCTWPFKIVITGNVLITKLHVKQ